MSDPLLRIEPAAREEDAAAASRIIEEFGLVDILRERDPAEEAAVRLRPRHALRHVLVERGQHGVPPGAVDIADALDVVIEEVLCRVVDGSHHDAVVADVGYLTDRKQHADDIIRSDEEADTDARRDRLGEGAEVDHAIIERANRGDRLATVLEIAIRVVLEDGDVVFPRKVHDAPAALEWHR